MMNRARHGSKQRLRVPEKPGQGRLAIGPQLAKLPHVLILLIGLHAVWAGESSPHLRSGKYEVTLRVPVDGLYAQEEMEIELRIQDTSRPDPLTGFAPVVRASVEARIDMPDMPGMPPYLEAAHAEAVPGEYG